MSQPFFNTKEKKTNFIEIMDTTLRDGEQTTGVSFSKGEKLALTKKLLFDVKINRIEIASAKVSDGERDACKEIFFWAKKNNLLNKIEILGFVDFNKSVDWIDDVGGKVINLLCKGSKHHCINQLGKKPKEHFDEIKQTINYAKKKNMIVNVYLEDFSNGIKDDSKYVITLINILSNSGVNRIMLADTLGIFSPNEVNKYISFIVNKFPKSNFDFHAHNDYGLAVANSLTAINAGCTCIHTTINGLGERTGNTALEQIVPILNDFTHKKNTIDETRLTSISYLVEMFSKRRIAKNHPIVGSVVFTQTAGIHADGDKKGNLYRSKLSAKRFGREVNYALGKLSGKASVEMALRSYGIKLSKDDLILVLKKVNELGDKKEEVTKEDLLFIIDDLHENKERKFRIINFEITSKKNKKAIAKIEVIWNNKKIKSISSGVGGYNAFINSLKKIFKKNKMSFPKLVDYEVRIPLGGRTDAIVKTTILWKSGKRKINTTSVSTDQVEAAILATEKMVNILLKLNK